jgi:hypothetical protein
MSSLAFACTHNHEIIPFHNTLMINLSITYISLPCLFLISLFLSKIFKSRLFTSHICFQFRIQDHLSFKLTHMTCMTSDLDVLYMHGKTRRSSFQCYRSPSQLKFESPVIIEIKSFSSIHRNAIFPFHKTSSLALACTHIHEIITFHNTLMTNLSITYISLPCLCPINKLLSITLSTIIP